MISRVGPIQFGLDVGGVAARVSRRGLDPNGCECLDVSRFDSSLRAFEVSGRSVLSYVSEHLFDGDCRVEVLQNGLGPPHVDDSFFTKSHGSRSYDEVPT